MRPLAIILLVLASSASAQTDAGSPIARGSMLVSGSAAISHNTVSVSGVETTSTGITLSPNLLLFVRDRVALGGQVTVGYQSTEGNSSTTWGIGPAARVFFGELAATILPFVGASVQFSRTSFQGGITDADAEAAGFELVAGATKLLARNVGATAELYFERHTNSVTSGAGSPTFDARVLNTGLRLGISAFVF